MKIVRGDTAQFKFQRLDSNNEPILIEADAIYFTVKKNYFTEDYVIQKKLSDMTFDEQGYYHFKIEPEDTNDLLYKDYVYDIEVIVGDYKQTISKGVLTITEEVTYNSNEV